VKRAAGSSGWAGGCWCRSRRPTCCQGLRDWRPSPPSASPRPASVCCGPLAQPPAPASCMCSVRVSMACFAGVCWCRWPPGDWPPCRRRAPFTGPASWPACSGCGRGCRSPRPIGWRLAPLWVPCAGNISSQTRLNCSDRLRRKRSVDSSAVCRGAVVDALLRKKPRKPLQQPSFWLQAQPMLHTIGAPNSFGGRGLPIRHLRHGVNQRFCREAHPPTSADIPFP